MPQPSSTLSKDYLAEYSNCCARQRTVDLPRVEQWIDRFIAKTGLQLSLQQRQAVVMAATHQVLILTGGPGVGKSFTCRTIVALWKAMGKATLAV